MQEKRKKNDPSKSENMIKMSQYQLRAFISPVSFSLLSSCQVLVKLKGGKSTCLTAEVGKASSKNCDTFSHFIATCGHYSKERNDQLD